MEIKEKLKNNQKITEQKKQLKTCKKPKHLNTIT